MKGWNWLHYEPFPAQLHSGNAAIAYLVALLDNILLVDQGTTKRPCAAHSHSHICASCTAEAEWTETGRKVLDRGFMGFQFHISSWHPQIPQKHANPPVLLISE